MAGNSLVEVVHLRKHFQLGSGLLSTRYVHAVDDVSFTLDEGGSLGLVGESGSGKSTVARLVMRLIEPTSGSVTFAGHNIFSMDRRDLRRIRQQMAMVFQDPASALDPTMKVKDLVGEPLRLTGVAKGDVPKKVTEALDLVNLPVSHKDRYPHELSGGEKQRVGIARALITEPRLVIADEPTSNLDVSIQAQILELIKQIVKEFNTTMLFISHDLAVVKHVCKKVAVMYMGRLMELAWSEELFRNPLHPYTRALCSAVIEPDLTGGRKKETIAEITESSICPTAGCKFSPRCQSSGAKCVHEIPELVEVKPHHYVACHST
jgi:oligopeptide transport system ATP-binding protein